MRFFRQMLMAAKVRGTDRVRVRGSVNWVRSRVWVGDMNDEGEVDNINLCFGKSCSGTFKFWF